MNHQEGNGDEGHEGRARESHLESVVVAKSAQKSSSVPDVIIGTHFKMIWLTITGLTLMLALADILLSVLIRSPNSSTQQAIAMCDTFATVGFGGIFGMIGAKALG
jgi:hypothetical protein